MVRRPALPRSSRCTCSCRCLRLRCTCSAPLCAACPRSHRQLRAPPCIVIPSPAPPPPRTATWLRDPLHYFNVQNAAYQYMTTTDNMHSKNPEGDDGAEADPNPWSGFNSGTVWGQKKAAAAACMHAW